MLNFVFSTSLGQTKRKLEPLIDDEGLRVLSIELKGKEQKTEQGWLAVKVFVANKHVFSTNKKKLQWKVYGAITITSTITIEL